MADEQELQGSGRGGSASESESEARGGSARAQRRPSKRTISREQRRQRSEQRRGRRRRFYLAGGGIIALALIAGLVLPSIGVQPTAVAEQPDEDVVPVVGTEVAVQPGGIIEPGEEAVYDMSPPTSGPRLATGAEWGFHDEQAPDEAVVRNLEQGAVVFNHSPGDPGLAGLRSFIEGLPGYPGCYVAHPYAGVAEGEVVLTAWGWTHTAAVGDTDEMELFATNRKNQAPLFIDGSCGASLEGAAATASPAQETPTPTAADGETGETATPEATAAAEPATPTPAPASEATSEPASTPTEPTEPTEEPSP